MPRTVAQADALEKAGVKIDHVVSIEIDDNVIEARMTGRRVCSKCGESYHISTLNGATTCAKCGGELYRRADDNPETVKARLETYNLQTAPLIEYYKSQGKLKSVTSGEGSPDEVFAQICKILG